MNPNLPSLFFLVNKKVGGLLPLLFTFYLRYNYQLNKHSGFFMDITPHLNNHLLQLGLNKALKYTYLSLLLDYSERHWFYFDKTKWLEKYNLKRKQFEHELEQLKNNNLLQRKKDTYNAGDRKIGNALFLKLTPPDITNTSSTINPNKQKALTFTGTQIEETTCCYEGKQITEIKLKNVRSEDGRIFFSKYWVNKDLILFDADADADAGQLFFKAVPYIAQSEQLLLNIIKH